MVELEVVSVVVVVLAVVAVEEGLLPGGKMGRAALPALISVAVGAAARTPARPRGADGEGG